MGVDEELILSIISSFAKKLPRFSDGRIDYSESREAPVLNVVIRYKDEILLLKRSGKVLNYAGKWNNVGGYLDEVKPPREKVLEELEEELGIGEKDIASVDFKEPFEFEDEEADKTWLIHPVLVDLKRKSEVELDWEHTDFSWINPKDLREYDIIPGLVRVVEKALS